jgi:NADPH:quinone reductase-like Zn-dependent oxidoreductase
MQAMVLEAPGEALVFRDWPDPRPGPGTVRIRVGACGVCRTDLHVVDGELPNIPYPIVPGHEVVGRVDALGPGVIAARWRTRRRPLAGRNVRRLSLLQGGPRKSLRSPGIYRLYARRRIRLVPRG